MIGFSVECIALIVSEMRKVRAAKGEHALFVSCCVLRLTVVSRLWELIDCIHQRHPSFQNRATPLAAEVASDRQIAQWAFAARSHEVGGIVLKTRVPLVLFGARTSRIAVRRFCR